MDYVKIIQGQIEHLQKIQELGKVSGEAACDIAKTILLLCQQITSVPTSKKTPICN
ncbi:hypothetical protein SBF1_50018 [Candidatus Desulfosporosinus infrequens]|uniref:Uncharacterized protein n=1 Tax=Candidatus Desulfosporosinus infrequens TaxID=2043169 RepID=A0A2U3LH05_9FIRM|nr:hypothetical protein SBF1_50018 [Candidatus Desulfosporosinus infrequens]